MTKESWFNLWQNKRFFSSPKQTASGTHTASYTMGTMGSPPGYSSQGVKLTTHLHLVPGLRMSGAFPKLHPYACKAQGMTILPFLPFTSLYIYNLFACNHFVISHNIVEPWHNDISEMASLIYKFFFPATNLQHTCKTTGQQVCGETNGFLNPSQGSEKSAHTLNDLFCNSKFYFQICYDYLHSY
jgi:hypothetical protein